MTTTTTRLSNTARTILRTRLRRAPNILLIQQAVEGTFGKGNISDLSTAQLLELAGRFLGPDAVPTEQECADYEAGRAVAVTGVDPVTSTFGTVDAASVQPEDEAPEGDEALPVLTDPFAAEIEAVRVPLGRGDYQGFEAALRALVERANKPAEVVEAYAAPAGSAARLGVKSADAVGIPVEGVLAKAASLAVYDAGEVAVDPLYEWPRCTGPGIAQLGRGRNLFLTGPMGSGKTTWAQQLAAHFGRPFVRISCDDQTEAAQLVGMTIGKDDAHRGVWQDGQLAAAIRRPGCVILIDEPSLARPGALFVFQSVLDADRKLHIAETGEVVRVAADVLFIAADNTNGTGDPSLQYEGTRVLNRAFLDRSGVVMAFDYMNPVDEARVLAARTKCDARLAAELCKVAALTRNKSDEGGLSHGLGFRRLVALAELMTDGTGPDVAFQMAVIDACPYDDRETLRQLWAADFNFKRA